MEALSTAAFTTQAPRSMAVRLLNPPWKLPEGVRTALKIGFCFYRSLSFLLEFLKNDMDNYGYLSFLANELPQLRSLPMPPSPCDRFPPTARAARGPGKRTT
jgi:hypothetical protein